MSRWRNQKINLFVAALLLVFSTTAVTHAHSHKGHFHHEHQEISSIVDCFSCDLLGSTILGFSPNLNSILSFSITEVVVDPIYPRFAFKSYQSFVPGLSPPHI